MEEKRPPLIKQTPRDEFYTMVEKAKRETREAEEKVKEETRKRKPLREIAFHAEHMHKALARILMEHYGLNQFRLDQLTEDHFRELERDIANYARPRSWLARLSLLSFVVCVPVVSWCIVGCKYDTRNSYDRTFRFGDSWKYMYHRGRLKKLLGKEYSLWKIWRKRYSS